MSQPGERGLQRERTSLSWDRTGVAFMVVGALLLRVAGPPYLRPAHVPGFLTVAFGAALVAAASRSFGGASPRARPWLIRLVGVTATIVSVTALAMVLLTT
jgi:hypothetical protein